MPVRRLLTIGLFPHTVQDATEAHAVVAHASQEFVRSGTAGARELRESEVATGATMHEYVGLRSPIQYPCRRRCVVRPRTRRPHNTTPGKNRVGARIGLFVLVGICVALFCIGAYKLPYAAGWAGTPGRITATYCEESGSSDGQQWECSGTFRSADGQVTEVGATTSVGGDRRGESIAVRRTALGGYQSQSVVDLVEAVAALLMGAVPLLGALPVRRARAVRARRSPAPATKEPPKQGGRPRSGARRVSGT